MAQLNSWGYVDMSGIDEQSVAATLSGVFSLVPESIIHGTPVTRLVIIGQHGLVRGQERLGRQSLVLDFASKVAKYMGASNGKWNKRFALDAGNNNRVTDFYDVNDTWKPVSTRHDMWDANLIWVEHYDRKSLFYPAFQTIYADNTSILNNFMIMAACAYLKRVAYRSWTYLSGKQLTREQLIEQSNRFISNAIDGIFHGKYDVTPDTYLTDADNERGYSWHCDITIKGNVSKTVGKYTINAERLD
jgi:hypothetical protein